MSGPVKVPTLDELRAQPELADALPLDALRELTKAAEALAADLRGVLLARRLKDGAAPTGGEPAEVLLDLHEAAARLRISPDTLYGKWKRLPFAFKDPLDGHIKFRASGIDRYIAARTARSTG